MLTVRGPAERGANMLEYVGITIVVAGVVVALALTLQPGDIGSAMRSAVCQVTDSDNPACAGGTASPGPQPTLSPTDPPTGDPTAPPTGDPTAPPTGDPNDPSDPGEDTGGPPDDYTTAEDEANTANDDLAEAEEEWGNLDEELLDLVAELVGWNSAKDCFTKGDIGACLETLLTAIPWGKLFKAAKMVPKIWKLFRRWQKLYEKVSSARKAKKLKDSKLKDAATACLSSFVPGTRVVLANGERVPIEDVRIGDRVLAGDPRTGSVSARPVTALISHGGATELVDVRVDLDGRPGGAARTVTATARHPFWVPALSRWQEAGALRAGDRLTLPFGRAAEVAGVRAYRRSQTVHNLTVAGAHTFYVMAGDNPVLVHNAPTSCPTPKITDHGLNHSFGRHAEQWFGRGVKDADKAAWKSLLERGLKSNKIVPWKTGSQATHLRLSRVDGKYFAVQTHPTTGDVVTAFVPNQKQLNQILGMLKNQ
ncbi:MAG: hypothetical protein GEV11_06325 [Streptosporangiales bacterium]|nr:hypothetical protein [Streptosporangiales bacterium]